MIEKSNPFRPRFSVRTLVIFVTLVCVYFGVWEATKRYGVPSTPKLIDSESEMIVHAGSPMPLVVWQDETENGFISINRSVFVNPRRRFYLWLFGVRITLPFESAWN
jgi:hypothetical protein